MRFGRGVLLDEVCAGWNGEVARISIISPIKAREQLGMQEWMV